MSRNASQEFLGYKLILLKVFSYHIYSPGHCRLKGELL